VILAKFTTHGGVLVCELLDVFSVLQCTESVCQLAVQVVELTTTSQYGAPPCQFGTQGGVVVLLVELLVVGVVVVGFVVELVVGGVLVVECVLQL
jgi:hypothetical protein